MRLMGMAEIARALGVGRQRAYQITRQKGFPDPIQALDMGSVWDEAAVLAWIKANRPQDVEG
jgi:predicted DNA-binding transcriptional regulator AlpA